LTIKKWGNISSIFLIIAIYSVKIKICVYSR